MDERMPAYEREIRRIKKALKKYLNQNEAREVTAQIYDMALDIDGCIDALLNDPRCLEVYDYNGNTFAPKRDFGFYLALDGMRFLEGVSEYRIDVWFGLYPYTGEKQLLEEIEIHVRLAKIRLESWKEDGTFKRPLSSESIAIIKRTNIGDISPLSPEERTFFEKLGMDET